MTTCTPWPTIDTNTAESPRLVSDCHDPASERALGSLFERLPTRPAYTASHASRIGRGLLAQRSNQYRIGVGAARTSPLSRRNCCNLKSLCLSWNEDVRKRPVRRPFGRVRRGDESREQQASETQFWSPYVNSASQSRQVSSFIEQSLTTESL